MKRYDVANYRKFPNMFINQINFYQMKKTWEIFNLKYVLILTKQFQVTVAFADLSWKSNVANNIKFDSTVMFTRGVLFSFLDKNFFNFGYEKVRYNFSIVTDDY